MLILCEFQVVVVVVVDIKAEIVADEEGEADAVEVEVVETEIGVALTQGLRFFTLVYFAIVTCSIECSVLE